jgi:hypothetical protein
MASGTSLKANNKQSNVQNLRMRRQISGTHGWRLLSSPVATNFTDFLSGTLSQGFSGATLPATTNFPNVLFHLENIAGTDNQRWRTISNISDNIETGRGYFVYFFGDQPDDSRYNQPFPHLLEVTGAEHDGNGVEVVLPVTYTSAGDLGWNAVGNPFAATLNWDDANWQKTNMDNVIYVWNNASSSYLTWNGTGGSLGNGLIAPFQGFWVKANGNGTPSLRARKASKVTSGTFYKNSGRSPVIGLELAVPGMQSSIHFTFNEDGRTGKDDYDAYRLLPFETNSYLNFYSVLEDGSPLVINNLPRRFGRELRIPLHVSGFRDGVPVGQDEFQINVAQMDNIPESWSVLLRDNRTGKTYNLNELSLVYLQEISAIADTIAARRAPDFIAVEKVLEKATNSRFELIINPGDDAADLPREVELGTNYPNPFNPATTLRFGIPTETRVRLEVFDILGRRLETLVDENRQAGYYTVNWSATGYASGIYLYRLQADGHVKTGKMTLIR